MIELLVVIAIIGVLASLLLPALTRSRDSARRIRCVSNLRQLGFAAQMYWDDNGGNSFPYKGVTNVGQILWCGWLGDGAEGERAFDVTQGVLYPYLRGRGVELCPSLNSFLAQFKLRATSLAYGYGYNKYISDFSAPQKKPPVSMSRITRPVDLTLFADAAQINDFLPPASPDYPMLEEFYYLDVQTNYSSRYNHPNGHFRHARQANAMFCDGHVSLEKFLPGSIDPRLPAQFVGQLRPEILLPQ